MSNERGLGFWTSIFFLIVVIAIGGVAYWYVNRPQDKIAIIGNHNFNPGELSPGGTATVTVRVKNLSDVSVAHNVFVEVEPFKAEIIHVVGENRIALGDMAPGEEMSPDFTISIVENSMSGTYNITISVSGDLPFQGDNVLTTITVTKS